MTNARDKANIPVLNFQSKGIDDNADATAITIDSSERVGIGTTSPAENLQVTDTASNIPQIRIETSDGGNKRLDLYVESSVGTIASSQSAQQLAFKTAGGEAVRIDATGKVGIGTSSPSEELEVSGGQNTIVKSKTTLSSAIGGFEAWNNSSAYMKIFSYGSSASGSNFGGVANANVALFEGQGASNVVFSTWGNAGGSNPDFIFAPQRSQKLIIKSDGKIGIGTSAPVSKVNIEDTKTTALSSANDFLTLGLTVDDNTAYNEGVGGGITFRGKRNANGHQTVFGAIAGTKKDNSNDGYTGNLRFFTNNNSNGIPTEHMRIDHAGLVGIGTTSPSPDYGSDTVLEISGSTSPGLVINDTGQGSKYGIHADSNDLKIAYGSTALVSFQNDGKVGIGTSSPGAKLHIYKGSSGGSINTSTDDLVIESNTTCGINILTNASAGGNAVIYFGDEADNNVGGFIYNNATNYLETRVNGAERMRIDSSGNVLIGTTSFSSGSKGKQFEINANAVALRSGSATTATTFHNEFHNPNGAVGSIRTSGTSTSYVTSSDYRLKENVSYDFDATTRLKQLKPARFNFIADADTTVDGFIAHEVSSVVPEAISGEKDAVNEDGSIQPQGIDQSKLVPLLVKTIQELEARITTLEANNP